MVKAIVSFSKESRVVKDPSTRLGRRALLRVTSVFAILAAATFSALAQTAPAQPAISSTPLKIGVIGAGREGGALGTEFPKAGHQIMVSSRHPQQFNDLVASARPPAKAGTVEQAAAFGRVGLLGVPYSQVER